ncbi:transmembrane 4 L6 family member 19 isoform X3 [Mus musculus]|uniref:transmembrane 4 L6 family member 19 isoform X3 n=1 Tax=Mus musculus TaxID=10090 RepID=UPI0003D7911A|nr:transmembrane 4 L6 family member 19 isoform X3 [Mus musculus]|eukprot:XP_006522285.1 PREDICTED: transmembrane 4 L6 family member 19 isoform X3 [Mus musculus]
MMDALCLNTREKEDDEAEKVGMLSFSRVVNCSRTCSRFLGLSLGTASLCAAGANIALLFPNWDVTYLMRGLIGKHAMLGSGLWGGGLMVLLAATLISMTGSFSKSAPCLQRICKKGVASGQRRKWLMNPRCPQKYDKLIFSDTLISMNERQIF